MYPSKVRILPRLSDLFSWCSAWSWLLPLIHSTSCAEGPRQAFRLLAYLTVAPIRFGAEIYSYRSLSVTFSARTISGSQTNYKFSIHKLLIVLSQRLMKYYVDYSCYNLRSNFVFSLYSFHGVQSINQSHSVKNCFPGWNAAAAPKWWFFLAATRITVMTSSCAGRSVSLDKYFC